MDIANAVRTMRERSGKTQQDLGYSAQIAPSQVSRHERGQSLNTLTLERYVEATGIPLVCTPDGWSLYDPPVSTVRFYGDAPCGAPLYIEDAEAQDLDLGDLTDGVYDPDRHYVLRARGESMHLNRRKPASWSGRSTPATPTPRSTGRRWGHRANRRPREEPMLSEQQEQVVSLLAEQRSLYEACWRG